MTLTGPCSVPNQRAPDHGRNNSSKMAVVPTFGIRTEEARRKE